MIDACTRITLDVQEIRMPVVVKAKRSDTGRKLLITLADGGVPYEISDDCYATFTGQKADKTKINNSCTIANNVVEYVFTEQTCAAVGRMTAEIKLYGSNNKLLTSASFILEVHDTVFSEGDEVVSEDEMNALDALFLETKALKEEVEQKLADGEFVGPEGKQGPPGEKGADGTVAFESLTEAQRESLRGQQGDQGPQGPQGEQGPPGEKGADGTMTFEDLTDEQRESLRGPQGEVGPAGPQGDQGPQGIQGEQGVPGTDGKTAYEYAKEGGYTGTEAEFAKKMATECLSIAGGNMLGPINMNGQPLRGLNEPAEETEAANKGYVDKEAINASSPVNLLDNSDFTNPVNQRNRSGYVSSNYCFDRWWLYRSEATIESDGITFTGGMIWQFLENKLSGKTITAVVELADGTKIIGTGTVPAFDGATYGVIQIDAGNGRRLDVNLTSGNLIQFIITVGDNSVKVANCALYVGEYTTAAVPTYKPKGYAAELMECMRYYWRCPSQPELNYCCYGMGTAISETTVSVPIRFPVPMRINQPTISASGNFRIIDSAFATAVDVTACGYDTASLSLNSQSAMIAFTVDGELTSGDLYYAQSKNDITAYIEVSADL